MNLKAKELLFWGQVVIFCAVFALLPSLSLKADDTLSMYHNDRVSIYLDTNITMYVTRFTIEKSSYLQSVNMVLAGDTGTVYLRIFGNEQGHPIPSNEEDLIAPISITKKKKGIQKISIDIDNLAVGRRQFFIAIERNVGTQVFLATDRMIRPAACSSHKGGIYTDQYLKTSSDEWWHSKLCFMVQSIINSKEEVGIDGFRFDKDTLLLQNVRPVSQNGSFPNIAFGDIESDGHLELIADGVLYRLDKNGVYHKAMPPSLDGLNLIWGIFVDGFPNNLKSLLFLEQKEEEGEGLIMHLYSHQRHGSYLHRRYPLNEVGVPKFVAVGNSGDGTAYMYLAAARKNKHSIHDNTDIMLRFDEGGTPIETKFPYSSGKTKRAMFCDLNFDNQVSLVLEQDDGLIVSYSHTQGYWFSDTLEKIYSSYGSVRRTSLGEPMVFSSREIINRAPLAIFENDKIERDFFHAGHRWVDVSGDGRNELVTFADCDCRTLRLYRETDAGNFVDYTNEAGLAGIAGISGVLCVDINGDGLLDLVLIKEGTTELYTQKNSFLPLYPYEIGSQGLRVALTVGMSLQEPIASERRRHLADQISKETSKGGGEDTLRTGELWGGNTGTLSAFPNPTSGGVAISYHCKYPGEKVIFEIVSLDGKMVWQQEISPTNQGDIVEAQWSGRNLIGEVVGAGAYFIFARSAGRTVSVPLKVYR